MAEGSIENLGSHENMSFWCFRPRAEIIGPSRQNGSANFRDKAYTYMADQTNGNTRSMLESDK